MSVKHCLILYLLDFVLGNNAVTHSTYTRVVSPWHRPVLLLLVSLFLLVAAQGTGVLFFARIGYLIIGLVLAACLWAWSGVAGLSIRRTLHTPRVMVGEYVREHIVISNHFPWQRGVIEVLDDALFSRQLAGFVVTLGARQQRQRNWRTCATIRGTYLMGPTYIVGSDPFGLFRVERRFVGEQQLIVHPTPHPMVFPKLGKALVTGRPQAVRQFAAHAPTIMSIREYRPGDAVNRIHWRSTAKRGHLMLKEGTHEPGAHIWLVYDAQRSAHAWAGYPTIPMPLPVAESTEEYAIQVLANMAQHWFEAGHAVGLSMHASERVVIAPQRNATQRLVLFDALAAVRAVGDVDLADVLMQLDAYQYHRTSMCVVTSRVDSEWVTALQRCIARGGDVCVVLIDASSFADTHDCHTSIDALQQANIPYTVVVQGTNLAHVQWE